MKLFIDTADLQQIARAADWGILDGVTTNPTHVAKTGMDPQELYPQICSLVNGPVSLETISLEADQIVTEAHELRQISDNVVVKVPVTQEGLTAVHRLAAEGIATNVTVTFSPLQALLAAKCGASYVSPFIGRLDAIGHDGMVLVRQIRQIYDRYGFETRLLAAAIRHPGHVLEAALIGADVCTMSFEVLQMLYEHPLTQQGIDQFLKDWEKVPKGALQQ